MADRDLRIMTRIIINAIEGSLKTLIEESGENTREWVLEFLQNRQRNLDGTEAEYDDPLDELFTDDLWQFAIQCSPPELRAPLKSLFDLSQSLNLRIARNASSHANKKFYPSFWYGYALLASRQEIVALGFSDVTEALAKAEKGVFNEDVPIEVLANYQTRVPTNFDFELEYKKTGFIGRDQEMESLRNAFYRGRTRNIALCGPGGVGKTAILQNFLHEQTANPDLDCILYFTFKTEALTYEGAKRVKIKQEYEELESAIADFLTEQDLLDSGEKLSSSKAKGIICIDNAETIFKAFENESQFNDLVERMPSRFTVIATSRPTPPENFKVVKVGEMKVSDIKKLAYKYAQGKSSDFMRGFDPEILSKGAKGFPLAVLLAIDIAVARKRPIAESAREASEMVGNWSFKALDEVLSEDAVKLLEFLRQNGATTLANAANILRLDGSQLDEAIASIRRSSMLILDESADDSDALLKISNLSSTFLVDSNRATKFRAEISEKIAKSQNTGSEIESFNNSVIRHPSNPFLVPKGVSLPAFQIIKDLPICVLRVNIFRKLEVPNEGERKKILSALDKLQDIHFETHVEYYKFLVLGQIYNVLRSNEEAEENFSKASNLDKSPSSKSVFANYYFQQNRFDQSENLYLDLIKNFGFSARLVNGYCLSLQYSNDPEKLRECLKYLDENDGIEDRLRYSLKLGAIKRLAESNNSRDALQLLGDGIKILASFLNLFEGPSNYGTIGKLITDFFYYLRFEQPKFEESFQRQLLQVLEEAITRGVRFTPNSPEEIKEILMQKGFEKGAIHKIDSFQSTWKFDTDDITVKRRVQDGDLKLGVVDVLPKNTYCFLRDLDGSERYFMPFSKLKGDKWHSDILEVGVKVAFQAKKEDGKELPVVTEAFFYSSE